MLPFEDPNNGERERERERESETLEEEGKGIDRFYIALEDSLTRRGFRERRVCEWEKVSVVGCIYSGRGGGLVYYGIALLRFHA